MNEPMKFPAGTAFGSIGHPIRRKEDARLLTGQGRFSDDFALDGQTHAAMVRSPHPHARIVRVGTSAAKAMPGVLAVLTGADCLADGLKPIPHTPVPATQFDMKLTAPGGGGVFAGPHMLLPADKAATVRDLVAQGRRAHADRDGDQHLPHNRVVADRRSAHAHAGPDLRHARRLH